MAAVNLEDDQFKQVEQEKQAALADAEAAYSGMIGETEEKYQGLVDASNQYAEEQKQLQQEQTDFTIEQIEQEKEKAQQDYLKEQSAAYVDYQKESAKHGVKAEQLAEAGLDGTGYAESSRVSMYNAYQNRVATARESVNSAVQNYNNAIKDAQLQNSSLLAEIAYNALQQELTLSLEGFQYKNSLVLELADKKQEIQGTYADRWQTVYSNLMQEAQLAEEQRQYNESLALQKAQLSEEQRQYNVAYGLDGGGISINDTYEVSTDYWQGEKAANVGGYGYFDNGYQPKGISINGVAYKAEKIQMDGGTATIDVETVAQYGENAGEKRTVTQNVWTAGGEYFYWEGRENCYKQAYFNEETGRFQTTDPGASGTYGGVTKASGAALKNASASAR